MAETLGLYLHVPFCKHLCPYCDFYKVELRDFPARIRLDFPSRCARELSHLYTEESAMAGRAIGTIYFGGGTPSTLAPEGVATLLAGIEGKLENAEITLEANPENLTLSRCEKWRQAGINRLSIGVQSFQSRDLKLLERLHQPELIAEAVSNARSAGFENLSLDLMFALPNQTLDEWLENLRLAAALNPEHLSFYGLTWHENTPFRRWLEAGRLEETNEDSQAEMYRQGAAFLEDRGYGHYEISNFARPGFESRHNRRYWMRHDVLGLGPGAHSSLAGRRWSNVENLEDWGAAIDAGKLARTPVEELSGDDLLGERLFTMLRTREGISCKKEPVLYERIATWAAANPESESWFRIDNVRAALTLDGWLLSDAIIRELTMV